jgi:predicted transcriptional regulator
MTVTELQLHSDGLDGMGARFIAAWQGRERGEHATFASMESFAATMTSKRIELLRRLHANGPVSVRALAAGLGRDYKTVHGDVAVLERAGIVERIARDRVSAPWRTVTARLDLAA